MLKQKSCLQLCLSALLLLLAVLALAACSSGTAGNSPEASNRQEQNDSPFIGRADPGYMQYLEKQSMLYHAAHLSPLVSGSNMFWRDQNNSNTASLNGSNADLWLRIRPQNVLSSTDVGPLQQLGSPIFWSVMRRLGAGGLYIAPTGGSGSMWNQDKKALPGNHEDIIQFTFAKNVGQEKDYAAIITQAKAQKSLLGGDIVPTAAGLGPDFFLATRNLRNYPGIFCMLEVPQALWAALPDMENENNEWQVKPLDAKQVHTLAKTGFIAPQLRQDTLPYLGASGWAATGKIRGSDGNVRRWVYRYAYSPRRPIFNIYDPSRTADMIFYGSSLYQAGILGNSFVGLQLAPLFGLESAGAIPTSIGDYGNYTAALALSGSLAQQGHAYGGWAWVKDELPLPLLRSFLQSGPDFAQDSITSPAAEHALLTGNAELLKFMLAEAVLEEMDFTRLVHTSCGSSGVSYALPQLRYIMGGAGHSTNKTNSHARYAKRLLEQTLREAREKAEAADEDNSLFDGNTLYSTPAGIPALALGVWPKPGLTANEAAEVRRGHMLLQFFKAMQPGTWMLDGLDLAGTLPIAPTLLPGSAPDNIRLAPLGSFPILTSAESYMASAFGVPKAKSLYGPLDAQSYNPASALSELAELIKLRKSLNISGGEFYGCLPTTGSGMVVMLTRLAQPNPNDNGLLYALAVSNFSRKESEEVIDLANLVELHEQDMELEVNMLYGDTGYISDHKNGISFFAPGWSKALALLKVRFVPVGQSKYDQDGFYKELELPEDIENDILPQEPEQEE